MPYLPSTKKYKWMRTIAKDRNKSYSRPELAKLYNTTRWRKLRAYWVKHNPLCVICYKNNIINEVDVVDHIKEISDGGAMYDVNNLQSLCDRCHRIKTNKSKNKRKQLNNK